MPISVQDPVWTLLKTIYWEFFFTDVIEKENSTVELQWQDMTRTYDFMSLKILKAYRSIIAFIS